MKSRRCDRCDRCDRINDFKDWTANRIGKLEERIAALERQMEVRHNARDQ